MQLRLTDIPKVLGVTVIYVLLAQIVHLYLMNGTIASVFRPASGLALAALLIGGRRYAWSIFAGSLLNNVMSGFLLGVAVPIALGNTLAAFIGAWLLTRNGRSEPVIDSLRNFLRLILLGGCVAGIIPALAENTALLVSGFISSGEYIYNLLHFWMGYALGVILITPLFLAWWKTRNPHEAPMARIFESILLLGMVFLAGQVIFLGWFYDSIGHVAKAYWTFLFIAWVAVRLGIRVTMVALNIIAVQALLGAYRGIGFFADDIAQSQLVSYWFYTLILSVVGMALATYFTERKLTSEALRTSVLSLQAILDNSPYIAWLKDTKGCYINVNKAYVSYVRLQDAQQVIGKTDFDLWPKELAEQYSLDDAEVMAQRQQKHIEESSLDGNKVHWVETFKTPVIDEEGHVLGTTGFARDITERKLADEALRRSEAQLRTLYDSTSDAVMLLDENGFFYCNRASLAMFGCATPDEFYTRYPADFSPLVQPCGIDSMTLANQNFAMAMEKGRCQFEWVHQRADTGQGFFTDVLLNRMELDGRMVIQATVRDITERRKAEDTLRKLSLAVEQSHSSVIITDLNANIEYVNQAFLSETGYSLGEVVGQNPRLLNSGKNPASAYREMWACLICGEVWKGELVNRRKDGSEYIVSVLISPVRHADGSITHYLGVREDISERKKREAEIVLLNQAYSLLSRANEAIVRTQDRNELFTTICSAAVASEFFRFVWIGMLDEKRSLVIPVAYAGVEEGYRDKLNIRLDDERTEKGPVSSAIRTDTHVICQDIENDPSMAPWRDEALKRGYRASGAFPISEGGIVVGVINIYAAETYFFTPDITQLMLELAADMSFALDVFAEKMRRKQAEDDLKQLNLELESRVQERTHQLEVANNELEAFSYSVSHDLRAPLRSIDGFSQILSKNYHDSLDDTGKSYLERVRRASQRMGHLIDDLLRLSQVTRNSLRREQIDLSAIAEKVVEDLRKMKPTRQVHFVLQQGLSAYADPGLLRVVMDNLLGNAYKFTGKKADAKIEFGMSDSSGENAFFIRDNGAGFNMDYAHKLFGAFQRLHGANEFEGTGIGLATVQRIIHRHHGRVWAEAKEGQGATFYFTLPQRMRET